MRENYNNFPLIIILLLIIMLLTYFLLNFYSTIIIFRILCSVFDVIRSEKSRIYLFFFLLSFSRTRAETNLSDIEWGKICVIRTNSKFSKGTSVVRSERISFEATREIILGARWALGTLYVG